MGGFQLGTFGAAAPDLMPCCLPSSGCSLAVLCPPLITAPAPSHSFLRSLQVPSHFNSCSGPACSYPLMGGFCSQETHSLPLPLPIPPPAFLLSTFWKENNQGAAKSREGWAAACTLSLGLSLNDGSSSRLGCSPRSCLQGTRATVFLMGQTPP